MPILFRLKNNIPKKLFDVPKGERARDDAMDELLVEALKLFGKTTATYQHKVVFTPRLFKYGWRITTTDKIYPLIDFGTPPHIIRPRRARHLAFAMGGRAKTKPRVIGSTRGSKGNQPIFAMVVHHPGTEPREFSPIIQERIQAKLPARFKRVMKEYKAKR